MKMVKSLILGSAAGLVAMSGAQAADLPVKAKAVEYVKICSLYGAGFYYIPGTDTCIKIGGYVRAETTLNPGGSSDTPAYNGDPGIGSRFKNDQFTRSRLDISMDTRTATEYGVVRSFADLYMTYNSYEGATYNTTARSPALGTLNFDSGAGASPGFGYAFIQFAGFTFGKSNSAYFSPWAGYLGNNSNGLIGLDGGGGVGINNIQYTAQFGNGVSASFGLDDPTNSSRALIYNLNVPLGATGTASDAYAGSRVPDFAANVKIDQAWGLFQLSGLVHEVDATYNTLQGSNGGAALSPGNTTGVTTASALSGHPDAKAGYALQTDLWIKNIPTGAGDDLKFEFQYTKGVTHEIVQPSGGGTSPNFLMTRGSTIGFGATTDAIYVPAGSTVGGAAIPGDGTLHLTTGYAFAGAFNHNWNPNWATSLYGTQTWVKYDGASQAAYCANYAAAVPNGTATNNYTCNPNYTVSQVGSRTIWTPIAGLAFSAEVTWTHLGTGFSGFAAIGPGAPFPVSVYTFKGQNTETALLRVQRNF